MANNPSQFQGTTPAWMTGSYGYRKPASKGGHIHKGVDIYAQQGTSVLAPVAGTIKAIGDGSISGKYVKVQGDDGNEYYYAHLNNVHGGISRGMRVNQGTVLGGVGNSGNASGGGHHLHFEVRRNGHSVSPNEFLQTGTIQDTTPLSAIPGLNTIAEVEAYADELFRAIQASANVDPFDPSGWGQDPGPSEEDLKRDQTIKGQSILGATLDSMSQTLAGGPRSPLPRAQSTALDPNAETDVPTAEQQRAGP